ncbi:uncharacterized protein RSE6_08750 [Rhynchosporium secalis]|uniref:N-acetyltransferase domain-containing protein n=1 Tax=Rhynchosporium secalis TaxID=38038 RepID=A0A1E1MGC6_RHYSE|nr:uncharacterized protein RSE6_08750 [Rhynchosporium secalis]
MYIRGATARDLHRLAEITITSLKNDPAFDFMWPYRHEYPKDNFFFWQQTLQSWLYDKISPFSSLYLILATVAWRVRSRSFLTLLSLMPFGRVTAIPTLRDNAGGLRILSSTISMWGLNEADREKAPCKVEASPMGKLLYAANGFHDLALFTVSAEGQKESLELWAMRRDPVLQELQDRTRT